MYSRRNGKNSLVKKNNERRDGLFGVLIYLLGVLILRGINSIALSINTFSTLGFGDIPVTGISRYVAIMERFHWVVFAFDI